MTSTITMTTRLEAEAREPGLSRADAITEAVLQGLDNKGRDPPVDPAKEAQLAQMKARWIAAQKKKKNAAPNPSRYWSGARRHCADGMDGHGMHGAEISADSQGLCSTGISRGAACEESHSGDGRENSGSIIEDKDSAYSEMDAFVARRPALDHTEAVGAQKCEHNLPQVGSHQYLCYMRINTGGSHTGFPHLFLHKIHVLASQAHRMILNPIEPTSQPS